MAPRSPGHGCLLIGFVLPTAAALAVTNGNVGTLLRLRGLVSPYLIWVAVLGGLGVAESLLGRHARRGRARRSLDMTVIDRDGRVFGRINLIDAAVAVVRAVAAADRLCDLPAVPARPARNRQRHARRHHQGGTAHRQRQLPLGEAQGQRQRLQSVVARPYRIAARHGLCLRDPQFGRRDRRTGAGGHTRPDPLRRRAGSRASHGTPWRSRRRAAPRCGPLAG